MMKMRKRKGQSAMEYLMTYGLALIIIIGVVAALISLNVFSPSTQAVCTGFTYFKYSDHNFNKTTGTADFSLQLTNTNNKVDLTGMSFTSGATGGTFAASPDPVNIGQDFIINLTAATFTGSPGDTYSVVVQISYDVVDGIPGRVDTGTCTGKIS